jgi:hypothetical protein
MNELPLITHLNRNAINAGQRFRSLALASPMPYRTLDGVLPGERLARSANLTPLLLSAGKIDSRDLFEVPARRMDAA